MTIINKKEVYLHPDVDVKTLFTGILCTSDSEFSAGLLEEDEFVRL